MADIRCPMCGRNNPEDRDVCEFCGARLKPLTGALAAADAEPIHPGEEPTPRSTSELENTLPEWLRNLRQGDEKEAEQPALEPAGEGDEADDFFKHLAAVSGPPHGPPDEPAPEPEASGDDFLGRLAAIGPAEAPAEPASESQGQAPTDDLLAGLSTLGAVSEPGPATPTEGEAAQTPPDWLAGLSLAHDADEEETPDWLKDITGTFPQQMPAAPEAAGDEIDWRSQLGQPENAAPAPPSEPESEWKGFAGDTSLPPAELGEQPAESEESPEWLKDLESQAGGAGSAPQADETKGASEETPAWLAGLHGGTEFTSGAATIAAATPEEPGEAASAEEDIPDWLKPAAAAAGAMMSASTRRDEPLTPEGVPDWLKGSQEESGEAGAIPAEEETIPDWLKPAAEVEAASAQEALPAEETPDWLGAGEEVSVPAEEGEVPDWLKGMAAAGAAAAMAEPEPSGSEMPAEPATLVGPSASVAAEAPAAAVPETGEEEETPAWLKGLAAGAAAGAVASAAGGESEAAGEELFPAALPAWLDDISPAEEGAPAAGTPPAEGPISQGELPSWVEAMRPVEAAEVAGADEEQVVEEKGPLAGFSNVLPIASAAAVHRVSAYPNKLLVNESQQAQVEMLERQVAGERTAKPALTRARISSNRMLRWGIAALLLAFVALPIIFQSQVTPGVRLFPPELVATIKVVNDLPPSATVLVVVDYQPASSGELEAVTTPLLDQLRLQGVTAVFVSSTAPGSALAERLVARVDSDLQSAAPQQYLNLGYLTGGASGIAAFAADPAQAGPQTISGLPAWGLPPLQDVNSLSDFAAMLVLTDSSDTGAMWIEQARARLGDSPLLLGISAQAEPMLQPYYDSQQVQGMVTGLSGGVAYEQANGISSLGSHYWDAFSVGFLVADFIVAIGGVMALFAAWQSRRAQPVSEAA